jgi:hypothetical protein
MSIKKYFIYTCLGTWFFISCGSSDDSSSAVELSAKTSFLVNEVEKTLLTSAADIKAETVGNIIKCIKAGKGVSGEFDFSNSVDSVLGATLSCASGDLDDAKFSLSGSGTNIEQDLFLSLSKPVVKSIVAAFQALKADYPKVTSVAAETRDLNGDGGANTANTTFHMALRVIFPTLIKSWTAHASNSDVFLGKFVKDTSDAIVEALPGAGRSSGDFLSDLHFIAKNLVWHLGADADFGALTDAKKELVFNSIAEGLASGVDALGEFKIQNNITSADISEMVVRGTLKGLDNIQDSKTVATSLGLSMTWGFPNFATMKKYAGGALEGAIEQAGGREALKAMAKQKAMEAAQTHVQPRMENYAQQQGQKFRDRFFLTGFSFSGPKIMQSIRRATSVAHNSIPSLATTLEDKQGLFHELTSSGIEGMKGISSPNFTSNDRINTIAENIASSFISFVNENLGTTTSLAANSSLAFDLPSFASNIMKNVTKVVSDTKLSVEDSIKAISQTQTELIGALPSIKGIGGGSFTSALTSLASSITGSLTTAVTAQTSLHLADSDASMNFLRAALVNSTARALTKLQTIFPRVSGSFEDITMEGLVESYLSGIGASLEASSLSGANLEKISKALLEGFCAAVQGQCAKASLVADSSFLKQFEKSLTTKFAGIKDNLEKHFDAIKGEVDAIATSGDNRFDLYPGVALMKNSLWEKVRVSIPALN